MSIEDKRQDDLPTHREADEVDDRAALLLARLASVRHQRETPDPQPPDDGMPAVNGAAVDPEPQHEPQADPAPQPESTPHPEPRRMAPPPWQGGGATPQDQPRRPIADPPPPELDTHAPGGEQLRRPPIPPPGWLPGLPPGAPPHQPPGWPGTPPWFPPPPAWTPHSAPAERPSGTGDSATSSQVESRPATAAVPSLDDPRNLSHRQPVPMSGWRRLLHQATGGWVNPGMSARDQAQQDLMARIKRPIVGDFRIAVLSVKGGVGKTTTTVGLGSALAMVRNDRIVAVDANPDRGTLAERIPDTSTTSTVRDLLRDPDIHRYADVRSHTRMSPSRLEVLASEQDPEVAEVFGEADYRRTMEILRDFYNIILTDCGTGIMHSSMSAILDMAHAIVLVSSPAIDAARSASATLDWLTQHGHGTLAREAHVVLSGARRGGLTERNLEMIHDHFAARCASVHVVPFEPHLAAGAGVDFTQLHPTTVQSYLELAGAVAAKFDRART